MTTTTTEGGKAAVPGVPIAVQPHGVISYYTSSSATTAKKKKKNSQNRYSRECVCLRVGVGFGSCVCVCVCCLHIINRFDLCSAPSNAGAADPTHPIGARFPSSQATYPTG